MPGVLNLAVVNYAVVFKTILVWQLRQHVLPVVPRLQSVVINFLVNVAHTLANYRPLLLLYHFR